MSTRTRCTFTLLASIAALVSIPALAATNFWGPKTYALTSGAPLTVTETVAYDVSQQGCDGRAVFLLTIQNGGPGTSGPVSSAVVALNGSTLAAESDFNGGPNTIERFAPLINGSNALVIQLKGGHPGNGLTITIRKQVEETAAAPLTFVVSPGQRNFSGSVAVASPGINFVLSVVNGDSSGRLRVKAGVIALNGATVVSPADFTPSAAVIRKTVAVAATNSIAATLDGPPGSFVTLSLTRILDDSTCEVAVKLLTPAPGATVTERRLQVGGTVAGGSGVALTVNGMPASIDLTHAATFGDPAPWFVLLDPDPGAVHITAIATNGSGATARQEEDVTFAPSVGETIMLRPSVASGVTPLDVAFLLDARVMTDPSEVSLYEFDLDGDGVFEVQTSTLPDTLSHRFEAAGVFNAAARVTMADGRVFRTTTPIVVQPFAVVDGQLRAIWNTLMDDFRRSDVDAATKLMTIAARNRYLPSLMLIRSDLPNIAGSVQNVLTVFIGAQTAHYLVTRDEGGHTFGHHIYFVRDGSGTWRLEQF